MVVFGRFLCSVYVCDFLVHICSQVRQSVSQPPLGNQIPTDANECTFNSPSGHGLMEISRVLYLEPLLIGRELKVFGGTDLS